MPEILEMFMMIGFGISWPISIIKSIRSRTVRGKSLLFLCFIFIGYICGIASKLAASNITYVLFFYILNFVMVGTDLILFFINKSRDNKLAEKEAAVYECES